METVEPLEKEKAELKSKLHEATAEGERLTAEVKMWKSRKLFLDTRAGSYDH